MNVQIQNFEKYAELKRKISLKRDFVWQINSFYKFVMKNSK